MLLYGASGHCKVIIDCLLANSIPITGIFDDNPSVKSILDFKIIGEYNSAILNDHNLIISIGQNTIRKKISKIVKHRFGKVLHPSSIVSSYTSIGHGTVLFQRTVVQAGCEIGKHVIVNTSASIDHDCILQDFVHVSPNVALSGNVLVDEGTHIGTGASCIQGIKIGKWCTVGAGTAIIRDIPDYAVVVGNPGRIIRYNASYL